MEKQFAILRTTRNNVLKVIQPFTDEQLNKIPAPFNNNLIWNLGHILVTQQLLMYRLSGLDCLVDNALIEKYRKGSKPTEPVNSEEIQQLRQALLSLTDRAEADFNKGVFQKYKTYPTSYGYTLNAIEDAIHFNNVHESMHLGTMMAIRKFV